MSSEPPEEPHRRSEFSTLSPASPKPIHFPTPAHIPVLEMQMDVGFNQTEAHMNDPAMHNTEVRPGSWQEPSEQPEKSQESYQPEETGIDMTYATGESSSVALPVEGDTPAPQQNGDRLSSNETPATGPSAQSSFTLSHPPSPDDAAAHEGSNSAEVQLSSGTSVSPSIAHQSAGDTTLPEPDSTHSAVDVQSLIATLHAKPPSATSSTAPGPDSLTIATTVSPSSSSQTPVPAHGAVSSPLSASNLGLPPSGLPPRPPPQEQPLIHPDYVHSQHIRDYHPHAAHSAYHPNTQSSPQGSTADLSSRTFVPPVNTSSLPTPQQESVSPGFLSASGEPTGLNGAGSATSPSTAQIPGNALSATYPGASLAQQISQATTPVESRRETALASGGYLKPEDRPWTSEIQRKYDRFLDEERRYVSEGRWEQFPQGSRLFVGMRTLDGAKMRPSEIEKLTFPSSSSSGNLSSERVTKRDIFHVFHVFGELAQISIKQAYGFVQFLRAEDCARALEMEQGTAIRDKRIHLEVSKPQKNRNQPPRARSRSPDYARGKGNANVDRYVSSQSGGRNNRGSGAGDGNPRGRNYRSPSPRGYRERHDTRHRGRSWSRSRSRSRSPHYTRDGGRFRSPPRRKDSDDDLPLPKRDPSSVPDVQLIVLDHLEREFVAWVEQAFSTRGLRVDSLLLSPRLSEQAVVRRQIVEGVVAVSKMTRANQSSSKIGLQIFNRRGGANNVSFEEYENLDPSICAELVLRAKSTNAPSHNYSSASGGYGNQQFSGSNQQQSSYSYGSQFTQPGFPHQAPPGFSQGPTMRNNAPQVPPNLQHLITNLNSNDLQNLLSAMNPQSGGTGSSGIGSAQSPFPPGSAQTPAFLRPPPPSSTQQSPAMGSHPFQQQLAQQQPPSTPGSAQLVNMADILARLGTYKQ